MQITKLFIHAIASVNFVAITPLAYTQQLPAPSGWEESNTPSGRVITKDSSRIEVGHWQVTGDQTMEELVQSLRHTVPTGADFISSGDVKAERIPGAYAATQKITLNGKSGQAVIYGCPGEPGVGRILRLAVENSKFLDLFAAGSFLETICKDEPKGSLADVASTAGVAAAPSSNSQEMSETNARHHAIEAANEPRTTGRDLVKENAKIPNANRPLRAYMHMEQRLEGYPAMLVLKPKMMMTFANGWSTYCSDWDLVQQRPSPGDIDNEEQGCKLTKDIEQDTDALSGFKPGERVELSLGRISGTGYDLGGSNSSVIRGGTVALSRDGRIKLGKWGGFSVSSGGNGAGGSSRGAITGRYYLNGYTITIETDDGEILNSFIGGSYHKGTTQFSSLFLAGTYFWDRDK